MRSKLFLILGLALIMAPAASSQTKITGILSCGKPDPAYSIEVGDRPGHSLAISKFACTWTTPMEYGEVQAKDGYDVAYSDASGAPVARLRLPRLQPVQRGQDLRSLPGGNDTMMEGKPSTTEGTWSYTGGTGKFKGIKGKGTYKGKADSSGTMVSEIEGDYELPAARK